MGLLRVGGLGLALLAVVFGYDWLDVQASPFIDRVEEFRQALKEDKSPDLTEAALVYRERNLEKRAAQVTSLGDLAQALILQEWRDLGPDREIAKIDGRIRQEMADRFEKEARELLKSGGPTEKGAAANLLGKFAAKARTMGPQGSVVRTRVSQLTPEVAALTTFDDPRNPQRAEQVRLVGAQALGEMQGDPAVVVPALKKLIAKDTQTDPRRVAALALVNMVRVLGQSDIRLALAGERLPADVGQLEPRRKDLVQVGQRVVEAADALVGDRDREVRRQGADAILQTARVLADLILPPANLSFPPSGRAPTQKEEEFLRREQARVKEERDAIMPLLEALRNATPALRRAAADVDPAIRILAFAALEQIGNVRDKLLRREASLPRYDSPPGGPEGKGAAGERANGNILLVRGQVADKPKVKPDPAAGAQLPQDPLLEGLTSKETWATLRAGMADPDPRVRLSAIEVLEMMGANAAPGVPDLTRRLADPDLFTRWAAARTLGRIGPRDHAGTVEGLARMVEEDRDLDARLAAAVALQRYGPDGRGGVSALRFALRTGDPDLRIRAIRALEGIGTDARTAVPDLADALSHRDVRVRRVAVEALGRFGPILWESPGAATAIEELRKAIEDPDNEVSRKASEALLRIPARPGTLPKPRKDI